MLYPGNRGKVTERQKKLARTEWNQMPQDRQWAACYALDNLRDSRGWLENDRTYVPNPDKFLRELDNYLSLAKPNHKAEVEETHRIFLEISGSKSTLNKLTPERRESISHRVDEALKMIKGTGILLPELMRASIKACVERHKERKLDTTLEHIFATTENFERWTKKTEFA